MKKILVLLLLLTSSAFGAVSFVQASPVSGGAVASTMSVTFSSSVVPGDQVCLFLASITPPSPQSVMVTDPTGSVYSLAVSVIRYYGFLGAWCSADALGSLSVVTATFTTPTIVRGFGIEYSGGSSTFAGLIGSTATLTGATACGTPSAWGFTYDACPTSGTTAMVTGPQTIQAGSIVVIFGGGLQGLPTVSSPWTSRASDAASNIELADQSFSSLTTSVQGAMTSPATIDKWGLLLVELKD
jgi:hypothetical protein